MLIVLWYFKSPTTWPVAMSRPTKNREKSESRRSDGTFARGNPGGPGRPEGSRNKATLAVQALLDGEAEALTRKAIELAKDGDMAALRLCMERIIPTKKSRSVRLDLPDIKTADDVLAAQAVIFAAMADGKLMLDETITVSELLEKRRRTIESTDLEARLTALEKAIK